jgi:small subunit ribosomal protein S21
MEIPTIKDVKRHIEVKVFKSDSEGMEKAIRILKKKIQNDGIFKTLKVKKYYEKPSEKKRRKIRENAKRKNDK